MLNRKRLKIGCDQILETFSQVGTDALTTLEPKWRAGPELCWSTLYCPSPARAQEMCVEQMTTWKIHRLWWMSQFWNHLGTVLRLTFFHFVWEDLSVSRPLQWHLILVLSKAPLIWPKNPTENGDEVSQMKWSEWVLWARGSHCFCV